MNCKLKVTILCLSLAFLTNWSHAQGLRVSAIAEKSVMGIQTGVDFGYKFNNHIGIGLFYQTSPESIQEMENGKSEFYGANVSLPIARCEKMILSGVLRGGLSNRRFVIVTPSIETELLLTKKLSVGVGLGIRATEAAINGKLIWNL